jgi:hypothetical protein
MKRDFVTFLRLELSDALRSKWAAFACSLYLCMAAAFVWLGLRESSVLGFTGLSRVLLNVTSAVIVVCPLVVLIGTHAAVVRARANGFCELMLAQPVKRSTWFLALLSSRLLILVGPFLLLLLFAALGGACLDAEAGMWWIAVKSLARAETYAAPRPGGLAPRCSCAVRCRGLYALSMPFRCNRSGPKVVI